jgi:hypothetical protein
VFWEYGWKGAEMTNEELRLAIAKAKGYRWYVVQHDAYLVNSAGRLMISRDAVMVDEPYPARNIYLKCPNWPTSITDAWELVVEMRLNHCDPGIAGSWEPGGYTASFCNLAHAGEYETFDADTAPRAICLAWLAWKEQQ